MTNNKKSFESLILEMRSQPVYIQETKIRRFLSKTPDVVEAWVLLIDITLSNNNYSEAVRVSQRGLMHYGKNANYLRHHIDLLLNLGLIEEARQKLNWYVDNFSSSIDDEIDVLELDFFYNSNQVRDVFKRYMVKHPSKLRVIAGEKSEASMEKHGFPEICFFLISNWHWAIQKSVVEALEKLGVSYYITARIWMLKILQPKILVVSDADPGVIKWIRINLPRIKIVSTRHGLGIGGKNYGLYAAAATDYICVSSPSIKQDLCNEALLSEERVWVTGFSQMDNLFKAAQTRTQSSNSKNVTFAPTFDLALSAISVIGDDPVHWIRGANKSINIVIRPHPHLIRNEPLLIKRWISLYQNEPNVKLDFDTLSELSSLLNETDVLISDVSSVVLQFMALNKPVICVIDLDKARSSYKYAPEELEWKMHVATTLLHTKESLKAAVDAALNEKENSETVLQRIRIRDYLFDGFTTGDAGLRIAEKLVDLKSYIQSK